MRAPVATITIAVLALATVPVAASEAAPHHGVVLCTWGGTPDAPAGVFTAKPGITSTPSAGPIQFVATGKLGGPDECKGRLTFRGTIDAGTSCAVQQPFHATASGLPPIRRVESGPGVAGSAVPVVLYDRDGDVVGSEQAQFLSAILHEGDDPALNDCRTPEGLTRAYWSDTVELVVP